MKNSKRGWGLWLGLAVLIRLILMPITLHGDLIYTNYFPYFFSYERVWDIYGYFGDHFLKLSGYTYYAPMIYFISGIFQFLLRITHLAPGFQVFMFRVHETMIVAAPHQISDYFVGLSRAEAFRLIFIMKLPYLVIEAACLWLLCGICRLWDRAEAERAFRGWLFHPVLLFSVYCFGTYRIYTVFFVLLVIYFAVRSQNVLAGVAYGLLLLTDNFPWILLLPTVLILGSTWRERIKILACILASFSAIFVPLWIHSGGYVSYVYASPVLAKAAAQGLTHSFAVKEIALITKVFFVAAYAWMLWMLARPRQAGVELQGKRAQLFVAVCAWILLIFYAASQTLVQYFMWVFPFWMLLETREKLWSRWVGAAFFLCLFFFNLDSRALNAGLFMPLHWDWAGVPSVHERLASRMPYGKMVAAARWLFSGMCLYFAYRIYRERIAPRLAVLSGGGGGGS